MTDPDAGASAVEYALIVSFIAVVIVASVALFGGSVRGLFEGAESCVTTNSPC